MPPATRREKGSVRNFANQLSQMATGWVISFDGPALVDEPDTGEIMIDVITGSASVNGRPADLRIATELHQWARQELARTGRDWTWLVRANVTIVYSRSVTPFSETEYEMSAAWKGWADHGIFDAVARVSTVSGDTEAASRNNQPLHRVRDLPAAETQPGDDRSRR